VRASPSIAGSIVYIGSNDGSLYALDIKTGELVWSRSFGTGLTTAIVANGCVYVSGFDGSVSALSGA
jgi:outer membrane protein assembly factor BamB